MKNKIAYGKVAEQYKQAILDDKMAQLTRPGGKEKDLPKKSNLLADPHKALVGSQLHRYRPTVVRYAKNFCLRLISKDDFFIAIRNDTRKLLDMAYSLGKLPLNSPGISKEVWNIISHVNGMLEGIEEKDLDIHMAPVLTDAIIGMVEAILNSGDQIPKKHEVREKMSGPLSKLPPNIRSVIVDRLRALGLDPNDESVLRGLARKFGLDPDEVLEQLGRGEIPNSLKPFLML
jgi:hypothetical protein